MKMTFAIPDAVGRKFRDSVPPGERSATVSQLLSKRLRPSATELAATCRRVNRLKTLEREMVDWEKFDDSAS